MTPGADRTDPARRRPLLKVLGVAEAAAVGIGVAIGAGIFRTPGYVAGFLDQPWLVLAAWAVGALLVLGDCLVLSELATRMPDAGGWYVYIEKGWGRFPAFLYGWTYMLVIDPASSAALVVALGDYVGAFLGLSATESRVSGIAITTGLFALSVAGIKFSSRFQDLLTYVKLGALGVIGIVGLVWTPHVAGSAARAAEMVGEAGSMTGAHPPVILAFGLALIGVLWTFEGYSNTTTLTEESVAPRRTLPRALIWGALALGVVYLLVNAAYLRVLGRDVLAGSSNPGALFFDALFGSAGGQLFALVAILAALGSLNGAALSAPRVAYALGRSKLAPGAFTRVTRLGTPDVATAWFAVLWAVYAWFGSFEWLIAVSIFIGALCNVAVTATLFVHRHRERVGSAALGPAALDSAALGAAPGRADIFPCPFYPVLPAVMLLAWSAFAAAVLYDQGWKVGYGLLATAAAGVVYVFVAAGRRSTP